MRPAKGAAGGGSAGPVGSVGSDGFSLFPTLPSWDWRGKAASVFRLAGSNSMAVAAA